MTLPGAAPCAQHGSLPPCPPWAPSHAHPRGTGQDGWGTTQGCPRAGTAAWGLLSHQCRSGMHLCPGWTRHQWCNVGSVQHLSPAHHSVSGRRGPEAPVCGYMCVCACTRVCHMCRNVHVCVTCVGTCMCVLVHAPKCRCGRAPASV